MTGNVFDGELEYRSDEDAYLARFDATDQFPSAAIVEALTAIEGRDALALEPLSDSIDADALDGVIRSAADDDERDVRVTIDAWEYEITVTSDGTILVRPTNDDG